MKKKGFTLFELLACLVVIIFIFFLTIPLIIKVINKSKLDSFKVSALNVLDSVSLELAKKELSIINPLKEQIDIHTIDSSILKNNNFESGIIINTNNELKLVNLKEGKYCASGTSKNLVVTDKGCGALDETAPTTASVFLKTTVEDNYIIAVGGYDPDSEIIKYELSVDGSKYYTNDDESYNIFEVEINDDKSHKFKVRVTNEAGLKLESDEKIFTKDNNIVCSANDDKLECLNSDNKYSSNLENWIENKELTLNTNLTMYTKNNNGYHLISFEKNDYVLNESIPSLANNMIPVVYEDNKWIKANPNTKYYDYENKKWANAVIVRKNRISDDTKSKDLSYYLSDAAIGQEIYEKDIVSFYVWIPKYSYKLWNINGNNKNKITIDVSFGNTNEDLSYSIHKAFLYEDNVNGFWVNKYPTSPDKKSKCYETMTIDDCDNNKYDIYSIPNSKSLVNISLKNAYLLSKNSSYIDNDTSHLLTNLEYGSIIYLAHSIYGIGDNITNNTTGNETGVYFNNTLNEMVLAGYGDKLLSYGIDEEKYIDKYIGSNSKSRILGDATLETDSWYDNKNTFVNGKNPFMVRGKNNVFSYNSSTSDASNEKTFRTALYVN